MFTVVQEKRRPSSLFDAMTDTVSKEHSHIRILILILRDMCRSKLILKQKWKVQGVPTYGYLPRYLLIRTQVLRTYRN